MRTTISEHGCEQKTTEWTITVRTALTVPCVVFLCALAAHLGWTLIR